MYFHKMKRFLFLLLLLVFFFKVNANGHDISLVSHFDKTIYKGANQNWSVSQDNMGIIYVANNDALLEYNGYTWKNHKLPNEMNLRSVSCYKDRIYCGSYESFGYWERDDYGNLKYLSLSKKIKNYNFHNEEIWKIVPQGNNVYFQSFTTIFKYDISNDKVTTIDLRNTSSFLFKVREELFTQLLHKGIYQLKNDKLVAYNTSDFFSNKFIKSILPYAEDKLLIATATYGIYIVDQTTITPINKNLNKQLVGNEVNCVIKSGDNFVIGTILNGIITIKQTGEITNRITKSNSLQNNTILDLFEDVNGNIWVAMDIGIDCINLASEINFYHDITGNLGSVYTSVIYDGYLYVGTNHGLYRKRYESNDRFSFIKGSQGQVWDLKIIDNILLCGHNEGTYEVKDEKIKKISDVTGGYCIREIKRGKEKFLIQSTYTKLVIYNKQEGEWLKRNVIDGLVDPIRYMEIDHLGNIWCSHLKRGMYKIVLDEKLQRLVDIKHYNSGNSFGQDYQIKINKINNRVVFSNRIKLYTYDDIEDNIVPYTKLNKQLGDYKQSSSIINASDEKYWFVGRNNIVLASLKYDTLTRLGGIKQKSIIRYLVDDNENIVKVAKDKYLICLDNGYAICGEGRSNKNNDKNRIFVSGVYVAIKDTIFTKKNSEKNITVKHDFNNIKISLSNTNFGLYNEIQYKLGDKGWQEVGENGEVIIHNLSVGESKLKIKLNEEIIDTINIYVKAPWYKTNLARISAFVILLLLLYLSKIIVDRYLKKQKHKIAVEQEIIQRRENEAREQKIIKLKNERLNSEIIYKSKQLADSTISVIEKKDLLQKIKKEISSQKEILGTQYPNKYYDRIIRIIDESLNSDNDWEVFQNNFNRAHNYFFKNISAKHKELTPNDLRLCAYLKMNLSSKEIASLMNVSTKTIEVARYRIRKKMNLNKEDNLTNYIMGF